MTTNTVTNEISELNSDQEGQEKMECKQILSSENIGKVNWINQADLASALSSVKIAKQYVSDIKSVRKSVHKIIAELTKSGYSVETYGLVTNVDSNRNYYVNADIKDRNNYVAVSLLINQFGIKSIALQDNTLRSSEQMKSYGKFLQLASKYAAEY